MAGPYLPNNLPVEVGMNPRTREPIRTEDMGGLQYKSDVLTQLRILDEQAYVNKIVFNNCPDGLTSQLIRRILYYRASLCMFYMRSAKKFLVLPYVQAGSNPIDCYGRSNVVTPVVMGSEAVVDTKHKAKPFIPGLELKAIYEPIMPGDLKLEDMEKCCVILHAYTPQANMQKPIPRAQYIDTLLQAESELLPFMQTAMLLSTGIQAFRVQGSDEASNVDSAGHSLYRAALTQQPYMAIQGGIDFQNLTTGGVVKAQEFLTALQGLENFRCSSQGLNVGSILEKAEHMLNSEVTNTQGNTGLIMNDELSNCQMFCDIANSIWGLDMDANVSETITGVDSNMDMSIENNDAPSEMPNPEPGEVTAADV